MTVHGFRLATFHVTPHYKPSVDLDFDDPQFGVDKLRGVIRDLLVGLKSAGDVDDKASDYLRIDEVKDDAWRIVLDVSGGAYGEVLEIVDTATHTPKGTVSSTDALLREGLVILVIPPAGTRGLSISQVMGGHHHGVPFANRLSSLLKTKLNLSLRVESDIADSVAWLNLLAKKDSFVTEVDLFNSLGSADRTSFSAPGIKKAQVRIFLEPGSTTEKIVSRTIKSNIKNGKKAGLVGLVGLSGVSDSNFPEQGAIIVHDNVQRKIQVDQDAPRFTYVTGDVKLERPDFIAAVESAASDTLDELQVQHPANWWPTKI